MENVFIARHPIFDRALRVYAYELLFRNDPAKNYFDTAVDQDLASSKLIADAFSAIGLDALGAGKLLFFNFTRGSLLKGYSSLLPRETAIIEILETVEPDDEVVEALRELRAKGFRIALDDFVYDDPRERLVPLADILKVDLLQTTPMEREELARRYRPRGLSLLAEKVETKTEADHALASGYQYLQGFFFSQPVIVAARELPASKLHLMSVLREIHEEDLDYERIERVLKQDASLGFKFLRFANSAFFGWRSHISSMKHALSLLGERETRKWVTLVAMTALTDDKPRELLVQACVRARLMELLAADMKMSDRASDLFLTGLLSLIDAALNRPIEEVLASVPVAADVKSALLGEPGRIATLLALARDYERGDWDAVTAAAKELGLAETVIPPRFLEAVRWSREALG